MHKLLFLFSFLVFTPALSAQTEKAPKPLAFTHVTVIDATGAPAQPDMTVVVTGNRITALGKYGQVKVPDDAQVIDASGKFLIPGLWDMHVHWYDKTYLPLFTANGVTGIRVMFGSSLHQAWQKEVKEGSLLGPRMVVSSRIVDGPKPYWPYSIAVANEEAGRQAVQSSKKEGYDFIKVYSLLPRDGYFAITDEAKKLGIPFAGHVPNSITAAEASDAGQRSIEHLTGILLACSSQETELHKERAEVFKNPTFDSTQLRRISEKSLDTYDEKKAAALFARFAKNGTWQVPTLTVNRAMAYLDDAEFVKDARLKYMPPSVRDSWLPKNDRRTNISKEAYAHRKKVYQKETSQVGAMHQAGVGILAGTDALNPYCFPGFSLHDELELLVGAGLSPYAALQAATLNPAKYLDQLKDFGTVEQGKIADLVLLDANPLDDIKNTRKISEVVVGGRLKTQEMIQKMIADAETAAGKK